MEKAYQPTREQQDYLEISSVLENAPYLLNEGESLNYVGAGTSNSMPGSCSSGKSRGSKATSLENSVSK